MSFALFLFGLLMFGLARVSQRQRSEVAATPVVPAARVSLGRVSLHGRAHGEPAMRAPITGTLSAYWEVELWDTRYRHNRIPIAKEAAKAPLVWLEDDTGRLPVLLHAVDWVFEREDEFPAGQPLPPGADAFVARHGYDWNSGHYRIKERRLEEGGPMYVHGIAASCAEVIRTLEAIQPSALGRALSVVTTDPHELAAYVRSRCQPDQRLVWSERRPLLIGNYAPAVVERKLGRAAMLCNVAGAVLMVLAVGLLLFG